MLARPLDDLLDGESLGMSAIGLAAMLGEEAGEG